MTVELPHPSVAPAGGYLFSFSSADRGDLGLVVTPFGALAASRGIGPFTITVDFSADVAGVAYGRNGLTLLADTATTLATWVIAARLMPRWVLECIESATP